MSVKDEAHRDAIDSEAQRMVNNALAASTLLHGHGGGSI